MKYNRMIISQINIIITDIIIIATIIIIHYIVVIHALCTNITLTWHMCTQGYNCKVSANIPPSHIVTTLYAAETNTVCMYYLIMRENKLSLTSTLPTVTYDWFPV